MGKVFLQQDYILKQLSASLLNPDTATGKVFWEKVYREARARFGTTNIPVSTFNKVWITADKAVVYEDGQRALVGSFSLKVMLDEDYLALQKSSVIASPKGEAIFKRTTNDTHSLATQIIRAIILPQLEKEVNTGPAFIAIRQVFSAIILANWYKTRLKEAVLNRVYTGKNKVAGALSDEPKARERIWKEYAAAYRKGVFNFIREKKDPISGEVVPRKYFSGGVVGRLTPKNVTYLPLGDAAQDPSLPGSSLIKVSGNISLLGASPDTAMSVKSPDKNKLPLSGKRVLYIDDDLGSNLMDEVLRDLGGAEVQGESDFRHAIDVFNMSGKKTYDIILLDIYHEDDLGINGFDVLRAIRKRDPDVPILIQSAFDKEKILKQLTVKIGREFEHIFVVEKPFDVHSLVEEMIPDILSGQETPLKPPARERKGQEIIYPSKNLTDEDVTKFKETLSEKAWKLLDMARDPQVNIPDFFVLRSNGQGELLVSNNNLRAAWGRSRRMEAQSLAAVPIMWKAGGIRFLVSLKVSRALSI